MSDTFVARPDIAEAHSQQRNDENFPPFISEVQDSFGAQKTVIFIYNVGPQEHNCPRPPNHPHMFLRGCPEGKPYILAGQIEHPFTEIEYNQNNEKLVRLTNGYREATKMLSPLNPGTDQTWDIQDPINVGGNLNNYGCFWSTNNPPTEDELKTWKTRLERTYRKELEDMAAIEAKEGPDGARARANNISHAAAVYFNQSFSWHRSDLVPSDVRAGKVDCQACGEKIMPKAKICMHCGAPTDAEKLEAWLVTKFEQKRGPGRPANA